MTVTAKTYASLFSQALQGNIKWTSSSPDTFKVCLLSSSDIANVATHSLYSQISSSEVTGTGYTAGGATVSITAPPTVTAANSWPVAWTASTAVTAGTIVRPAATNGYVYECVVAGTTGSSAPSWPTVPGQAVTDGTATWVCQGDAVIQLITGNASWSSSSLTAACAVLYDSTSGALIAIQDFGGSQSDSSGTFQVTAPTNGWVCAFAQ